MRPDVFQIILAYFISVLVGRYIVAGVLRLGPPALRAPRQKQIL